MGLHFGFVNGFVDSGAYFFQKFMLAANAPYFPRPKNPARTPIFLKTDCEQPENRWPLVATFGQRHE
jgi:hypothetical protein